MKKPFLTLQGHFFSIGNLLLRAASPLLLAGLVACGSNDSNFDKQDRSGGLSRQDYRDALAPNEPAPKDANGAPPIPEAEPLVATPNLSMPANARVVTISVNEEVLLRDVLVELARQANVGLELDPNISGSLIFSVRQRPFEEVIGRIADMAGLRYHFNGNVLRIELDEPYLHSYRVDYLNVARKTTSKVATNVDVVGGQVVGASGGSGSGNTSSSEISNDSTADFWTEIESNLSVMLARSDKRTNLLSGEKLADDGAASGDGLETPVVPEPAANPEAAPDAAGQDPAAVAAALAGGGGAAGAPGTATPAVDAASAAAQEMTSEEARQQFSVNRSAGIVTIFATQRQHDQIAGYLYQLGLTVAGQVLIEAKVLEVQLNDSFESGINWSAALGSAVGATRFGATSVAVPQAGAFNDLATASSGFTTLGIDRGDFDGVLNLVQQFGTVRTLSSPRVTVLHNQTAVLKVVENRVFFELDVQREDRPDGRERVTVESNIRTVPEGIVITVQPSIHAQTDEITMTLRPTITRITDMVNDPGVAIASNNTVQSAIPVIAVQEIDSVVTMRSGRVLIMGGLMQDSATATETGLPGASQMPLIGNLFKSKSDSHRQTELVIFLRASIVESSGTTAPDPADVELYKRFGRDRRPLSF